MEHLLQIIAKRGYLEPKKIAFTFHQKDPCTYSDLWQGINRCASYLFTQHIKNREPVLIVIPNSYHFFYAFFGIQQAGGIAVPVFPGSGSYRIIKIAGMCNASKIFISRSFPPAKKKELELAAKDSQIRVLSIEDSFDCSADEQFPVLSLNDTSFIQFTSGSSTEPKGVRLTHANIIINLQQMIAGMKITSTDTFVSWLPVYHDMGLILMAMVPFYLGIDLILLPTGLNYFETWLRTIQYRQATFTAAPDFAYRLCLVYIRKKNYDLSSLRVGLNAAEPVRAGTIKQFEERFNIKNTILPAYGLAEATVGVCSWVPGIEIKTDSRGFVSVGKPFPGVQIKIIKGKSSVPQGLTGEICVKSEANTTGYCNNKRASKKLFTQDGFIKTGDLGYCDSDGDYFIVGRKKNIIIQGGFNIAPKEIEELVDEFQFVRRTAAVGIDRGSSEGEQIYIFIESNLNKSQLASDFIMQDMTIAVVQRFESVFGMRPGRVYWLKHGAIPLTINGKIRYLQLKKIYQQGILRAKGMILFPHY